jgi:hypothetical protein
MVESFMGISVGTGADEAGEEVSGEARLQYLQLPQPLPFSSDGISHASENPFDGLLFLFGGNRQ